MLTTKTPAALLAPNWHAPRAEYVRMHLPLVNSTDGVRNIYATANFSINLVSSTADQAQVEVVDYSGSEQFTKDLINGFLCLTGGDVLVGAYPILSVPDSNTLIVAGPISDIAVVEGATGFAHANKDVLDTAWQGLIAGSGASWVDGEGLDTAGTAYLRFGVNVSTSGEDRIYPRGTALFVLSLLNDTDLFDDGEPAWMPVLCSEPDNGAEPSFEGSILVSLSRSGMRVQYHDGNEVQTILVPVEGGLHGDATTGDVVSIALAWVPGAGLRASISNNFGPFASGTILPDGDVALRVPQPPSGNYAFRLGYDSDVLIRNATWLDWPLDEDEISQWSADPNTYDRPPVSGDITPFHAGPTAWMPKAQSERKVSFCLAGAEEMTLGETAPQVRVRYGSDPHLADSDISDPHEFSTDDQLRLIEIEVEADGEGDVLYAQAEISYDGGTTWITAPLPRYKIDFAGECVPIISDDHPFQLYNYGGINWWGRKNGAIAAIQETIATQTIKRFSMMYCSLRRRYAGKRIAMLLHGGDCIGHTYDNGSEVWLARVSTLAPFGGYCFGNWDGAYRGMAGISDIDALDVPTNSTATAHVQRMARTRNPKPGECLAAEDQGPPEEPSGDSGRHHWGVDWLPALPSQAQTWAANHLVVNSEGANWLEKLGPLGESLRNFFVRRLVIAGRTVDLFVFDPTYCSWIDSDYSTRYRAVNEFFAGEYQWGVMEAAVALSDADHKIAFSHMAFGGRIESNIADGGWVNISGVTGKRYYNRTALIHPETAESQRLVDFCAGHGFNALLLGHNHRYAVTVPEGTTLKVIHLPSGGQVNRFEMPDYGSPYQRGRDVAGVLDNMAFWGWVEMRVAGTRLEVAPIVGAADGSPTILRADGVSLYAGSVAGKLLKVGDDGTVELDDAPCGVLGVCSRDDGDFATHRANTPVIGQAAGGAVNTYAPSDQAHADPEAHHCMSLAPWDEPYQEAVIDVSAGGYEPGDDVYVYAWPMELDEVRLNASRPDNANRAVHISPMGVAG